MADINIDNPMSHKGEVANAFAELLLRMDRKPSHHPIKPLSFLRTLQKCSPLFEMHQQHDAQEFLNWLLDAVHEGGCTHCFLQYLPKSPSLSNL